MSQRRKHKREDGLVINTCDHTWVLQAEFHTVAHDLHFQETSVLPSKTLLGMSMQCWWY